MERSCGWRVAAAAIAWGLLTSAVSAATSVWDGDTDGSWTSAANWTNDVALADGNSVEFYSIGNNLSTFLGQDWVIDSLRFNAGADSDVTIGGANTLTISNGIIVDEDSAGAHSIFAAVALAQNQSWTINSNWNFTVGGVISGDATLTKEGAGVLTLTNQNTFAGGLVLSAGRVRIGHSDAIGGGTLTLGGGALSSDGTDARLITNAVVVSANSTLGNATDNGALTLSGPMSLQNAVRQLTISSLVTNSGEISGTTTAGGLQKTGTGTLVLSGTNNSFGGAVNIQRGTLAVASIANVGTNSSLGTGVGTSRIRLGSGTFTGTLQYTGEGAATDRQVLLGAANADTGGGTINSDGMGKLTFTAPIFNQQQAGATANRTLTLGGAGEGEIQGIIRNNNAAAGTISLTKAGAGTWTLLGTNTYSGNTTISAGTLVASNNSAFGSVGMVTLANTDARLELGDGITIDRPLTVADAGNNKTLGLQGGATSGIYAGAITNNEATAANFDVFAGAGGTLTISGGISGAGGLEKQGDGTVVLSGANDYAGATTVRRGTLQLGANDVLSDAGLTLANIDGGSATVDLAGRTDAIAALTIGGTGATADYSTNQVIDSVGGGRLKLGGNVTYNLGGANGTNAAGLIAAGLDLDGAARTFTVNDSALADEDLVISGAITNSSGSPASLTKAGGGTLLLSGTNSYDGGTVINIGTLKLGAVGALPIGRDVEFGGAVNNAVSVLDLAGFDQTIGALTFRGRGATSSETVDSSTGPATLTLGGDVSLVAVPNTNPGPATITANVALDLGDTTRVFSIEDSPNASLANPELTVAGTISGDSNVGITKTGAGVLALSGSNTYSGATTVAGGILRLDSADALPGGLGATGGTSALLLNNGGVLALAGGDFFRGLGTGGSNVAWAGTGGFLAYGADRIVNLGGATGQLTWGQAGFVSGDDELILATAEATHTLEFQNHIVLDGTNRFQAGDGAAAIDGRLSGDLSGGGSFFKTGLGVIELTGSNTYSGGTEVLAGNLILAGANSLSPNTWLTISNFNVITLGGSDFTNALGGGTAGTVEWTGSGGFAAHGTDRFVNLGGATGQVTWGSGFFVPEGVDDSTLVLGAAGTSNTVDFQNPIDLGFSNRTVQANDGFAATDAKLSGVLSGAGGLTKTGAGTLALTAANTYTGITLVSAGTLSIADESALGANPDSFVADQLTLAGGTLQVSENLTIDDPNRGITLGTGGGTMEVVSGKTLTVTNLIAGSGGLTKEGAGKLVLSNANAYGATTIRAGTLQLGVDDALPETGVTVADGTLDLNGRNDDITGLTLGAASTTAQGATPSVIDSVGGGLLTLGGNVAYNAGSAGNHNAGGTISANIDLGGANRNFTVGDSDQAAEDLVISGVISSAAGSPIKLGAGVLVLSGSNTYVGSTFLRAGTLKLGANDVLPDINLTFQNRTGGTTAFVDLAGWTDTIGALILSEAATEANQVGAGAQTEIIDSVGGGLLRLGGTVTYNAGPAGEQHGQTRVSANLDLNGTSRTFAINDSDQTEEEVVISGSITNSNGTAGLTKTLAGTLVLAGANTYNGLTDIDGGTLKLGVANALPFGAEMGNFTISPASGTATLDLNGFNQTLNGFSSSGAGSSVVDNTAAPAVTLTVGDNGQGGTFGGVIQDTGGALSLTKIGTNRVTLSGINTYDGATVVAGGELALSGSGTLGSTAAATVVSNGAALRLQSSMTLDEALTLTGSGVGVGGNTFGALLMNVNGGTWTLNGAITLAGGAVINAFHANTGNVTIAQGIGGTGDLTLNAGAANNGNTIYTLQGQSSYDGDTIIRTINSQGITVRIETNNALPTATTLKLQATSGTATFGKFALNGFGQEVAGIEGSTGANTLNSIVGGAAALSTLTVNNAADFIFNGQLGNAGDNENNLALVKSGTGILALQGNNSYAGQTLVSGGVLAVNGSHLGGDAYTIAGGAALAGTGSIDAPVLVQSNAFVAPGNSIGTFTTTSNFTFAIGGVLHIEMDGAGPGASDLLAVGGILDITGATVAFTNLGAALDDNAYVFASYGSLIGSEFLTVRDLPEGYFIDYNWMDANQIALVIPEPGVWALLLVGGVALAISQRKSKRTKPTKL